MASELKSESPLDSQRQDRWLSAFPPRSGWLLLIALLIALPAGTLELLLPLYATALGATPTMIGILFGVGAALNLVVRPVAGWLVDRGRVIAVLLGGLTVYIVALGCFALADTYRWLLLGRLALAGGAASVGLAVNVLVARMVPSARRGTGYGQLTSAAFYGYVAGSVMAGLLMGLLDRETQREAQAVLESLSLSFPFPAGLSRVATLHLMYTLYAGIVALGFIAIIKLPALPPPHEAPERLPLWATWQSLIALPGLRVLLVVGWLVSSAYNVSVPMLLRSLQDRFGAGLGGLAVAYAIPGVLYAVAPGPLGRLADRWGRRRAASYGLGMSAIVYLLLPLLPSLGWTALVWSCEALAYSLYIPTLLALLSNAVPEQRRGVAFGLYSIVANLGAVVAAPLGGWLYEHISALLPFCLTALALAGAAWVLRRFGAVLVISEQYFAKGCP